MQQLNSRVTVVLFTLVATAAMLGNCKEFSAVFDPDGQRVCAVGQPDEVRLSTNMATLECVRLCDDNPDCVVFNLYDNTTCEVFTCPSELSRGYQIVEFCKSFRISDCKQRCYEPICGFNPRDCADLRAAGHTESGVYSVYPVNTNSKIVARVYCDMNSSESWLVFQRRVDATVNFERNWTDYADGFGDLLGNFWLGNEILYRLVANRKYRLRIVMKDWNGTTVYADYSTFSIGPSSDYYRLNVSGYNGTAGDSLSVHNGYQFSTQDADHDTFSDNCAQMWRGAWWFYNCFLSNLNGEYLSGGKQTSNGHGIIWRSYDGTDSYSQKMTEMKIAP